MNKKKKTKKNYTFISAFTDMRCHMRFFRKILEYLRIFPRANFKRTINSTRIPGH